MAGGDEAAASDERRNGDPEFLQHIAKVAVGLEEIVVKVSGLDTRVKVLEEGNQATHDELMRYNAELRANTMLTKQSHEAMFGGGDDSGVKAVVDGVNDLLRGTPDAPGLISKVDDTHQMLSPARSFFGALGKVGAAGLKVSDVIEKRPKTLLSIGLAVAVTSSGKLPEWAASLFKLLSA